MMKNSNNSTIATSTEDAVPRASHDLAHGKLDAEFRNHHRPSWSMVRPSDGQRASSYRQLESNDTQIFIWTIPKTVLHQISNIKRLKRA
ncbi:hypothetical protein O181_026256 [Austropuccinia psidii MF-1]|uniref:Uncharacterized protein n=1 Tax=Austropuccinia psidii MF-1 TaxID=1389203 RepID=A0A9Q3CK41_9BASI|nr:hypothetical protein [Austropuccinia psidii MF-1]